MRFEICASATLLVVQLSLPKHSADAPQPPVARAAPVAQHRNDNNAVEAANLEALWLAHNAGYHAPPCDQYDPLAVLDADLDRGLPGLEHVIGNRRYGVAMYAANHVLIARMPPLGCAEAARGDQSLSLSTHGQLIVHTRELQADGEHLTAHVVERTDDQLRQVIEIDLGGDRGDRQVTGAMYFSAGEVEVKYHGRQRAADGSWEAVDDHCTWDLATRSSSCRTRAAARR